MRTITITIQIEENDKPQTIKGSIMEQIAIAKENAERCKKIRSKYLEVLFNLRDEYRKALNESIGENLWEVEERENSSRLFNSRDDRFYVETYIYPFRYNTTSKNYRLQFSIPQVKRNYGDIEWFEPIIDENVITLSLHQEIADENSSEVGGRHGMMVLNNITSIEQVNKRVEKLYLKYFTSKNK